MRQLFEKRALILLHFVSPVEEAGIVCSKKESGRAIERHFLTHRCQQNGVIEEGDDHEHEW